MDANAKEIQKTLIEGIASNIDAAMGANNGKIPYGMMKEQLAHAKQINPTVSITRDQINNALRKRKKLRQSALSTIVTNVGRSNNLPSTTSTNSKSIDTTTPPPPPPITINITPFATNTTATICYSTY